MYIICYVICLVASERLPHLNTTTATVQLRMISDLCDVIDSRRVTLPLIWMLFIIFEFTLRKSNIQPAMHLCTLVECSNHRFESMDFETRCGRQF